MNLNSLQSATNVQGRFEDIVGACLPRPFTNDLTASQNPLYINVGIKNYPVRVNYWTESDPGGPAGYGHGNLTNSSDVTVQR